MDFDETRLYYSHQALRRDDATWGANDENNEDAVKTSAVRRHFREFLRTFSVYPCIDCRDRNTSPSSPALQVTTGRARIVISIVTS